MLKSVIVVCFFIDVISSQNICETNESPCSCHTVSTSFSYRPRIKIDCSIPPMLTEIPDLPSSTAILDFSNNRLHPDSIQGLCSYGYLEDVNLARNHLTYIPANSLRKCYITNSLNFSGNTFDIINQKSVRGLEVTQAIYGLAAQKFADMSLAGLKDLTVLELSVMQRDIPVNLFKKLHLEKLHFELTKAVIIPDAIFEPMSGSLEELSIKAPLVQSVSRTLLKDLRKLRHLEMTMPELSELHMNLFQSNDTSILRGLSLNGIHSIAQQTFSNLANLRILRINKARKLPSKLFNGLDTLEVLDLSNSHFNKLPRNCFNGLGNLQSLSLRGLGLTTLKKTDLGGMESLRNIDISYNEIRDFEPNVFYGISSSIDVIDMSHNKIKQVPSEMFAENSTLRKLHLNDNSIFAIDVNAFSDLPNLEEIHLQHNKIYQINAHIFASNLGLRFVDLTSNVLFSFPDQLFSNNMELTKLNFMDNGMTTLVDSITTNMTSLLELNVKYNPLTCNCDLHVLRNLVKNARILGDCFNNENGNSLSITDYLLTSKKYCFPDALEITIDQTSSYSIDTSEAVPATETEFTSSYSLEPSEEITINETGYTSSALMSYTDGKFETSSQAMLSSSVESSQNFVSKSLESDREYMDYVTKYVNESSVELENNETTVDVLPTITVTDEPLRMNVTESTLISPTLSFAENETINVSLPFENVSDLSIDKAATKDNNMIPEVNHTVKIMRDERNLDANKVREKDGHFKLALGLLLAVAFVCAVVLYCLYKNRRQSNVYQVSMPFDEDKEMFINGGKQIKLSSNLSDIREVPSIKIESVDDDGNLNVEMYHDPKAASASQSVEEVDPSLQSFPLGLNAYEQDTNGYMQGPIANMEDPNGHKQGPIANMEDPNGHMQDPNANMEDPDGYMDDPNGNASNISLDVPYESIYPQDDEYPTENDERNNNVLPN